MAEKFEGSNKQVIITAQNSIKKALQIECLTVEGYEVRYGVAYTLRTVHCEIDN